MSVRVLDELRGYAAKHRIPLSCQLELTQACNFSCEHCYCIHQTKKPLTKEKIFSLVDQLAAMGCLLFTLTGGEVMLRKDFIDVYTYIKEKGCLVSILTNGSLITEDIVSVFSHLPPHKVFVTLYGANEEQYAKHIQAEGKFEEVVKGIHLLKGKSIPIEVRTIAMRNTYGALESGAITDLSADIGEQIYYDTLVFPKIDGQRQPLQQRLTSREIVQLESKSPARREEWRRRIQNEQYIPAFYCSGGVSKLFIDCMGTASICGLYRKNGVSLQDSDVSYAWNKLNEEHEALASIYLNSKCASCKSQSLCRWCPAYSELENCNHEPVTYFCQLAAERKKVFS